MANDFKRKISYEVEKLFVIPNIAGNSVEEWTSADIGECAEKTLYKIHRGPKLTIWRHGMDNLTVDNITVVTEGDGNMYKYNCGAFKVMGECEDPVRCQDRRHCVGVGGHLAGNSQNKHIRGSVEDDEPQEDVETLLENAKNMFR